jgi:bifunctional DNA-binding transcriptional regulator/antitoxin component of YhaV-PrlF toxin-antitoxin module
MEKALISGKGVLQLPYALREKYGILDGGMALLLEQPDGILVKKLEPSFFDRFNGKWTEDLPTLAEFQAWSEAEVQADEARFKTLP